MLSQNFPGSLLLSCYCDNAKFLKQCTALCRVPVPGTWICTRYKISKCIYTGFEFVPVKLVLNEFFLVFCRASAHKTVKQCPYIIVTPIKTIL